MGFNKAGARRLTIAALTAACVAALGVGSAGAYRIIGPDWSYQPRPMGEPIEICTAGMPSNAANIIRRAARLWNYGGFSFTFRANGCSSSGRHPVFNGVNQVSFGNSVGGALASTELFFDDGEQNMLECDIQFNAGVGWYSGTGRVPGGRFDLFSVAVHEFGHCLGLDHSTAGGDWPVMWPTFNSGEWNRALGVDDIAGRNALYGG